MAKILEHAVLPKDYQAYVFDFYGTLVDIHTQEDDPMVWEKLAIFYGYYNAFYTPVELQARYGALVAQKEGALKKNLDGDPRYSHEASPEIELTEVFRDLFREKGVEPSPELAAHAGQFFRVLTTRHLCLYPGTIEMLESLKAAGKELYLLSNAQRLFTAYELNSLKIAPYFRAIYISSDYQVKKPDERFFQVLLEGQQLDVGRSLFVGNDSTTDIEGANRVGMDSFYLYSNISPKGDSAPLATYAVEKFTRWAGWD